MRLAVSKPGPPLPVREGHEEKKEHRFAEILRLQRLTLRMTQEGQG